MMMIIPLFISGAEIAFTLFIALLIFGADSIPNIARGITNGIKIIRDATGTIKDEIQKTVHNNGMDKDLTGKVQHEMKKIKEEFEGITRKFKGSI